MFGSIGITELIVIFVVALIVIGPKRLPDLAKTLGKTLRDFKRATSDFQESINLDDDFEIEPSKTEDSAHAGTDWDESEKNRIDPGGDAPEKEDPENEPGESEQGEDHLAGDAADKEDPENEPADSPESSSPPEDSGDSADEPPKERTQTT
ncbi:MAG: twin-arginine translocase TatA/TatE family subunit [bacterium]